MIGIIRRVINVIEDLIWGSSFREDIEFIRRLGGKILEVERYGRNDYMIVYEFRGNLWIHRCSKFYGGIYCSTRLWGD